MGDVCIVLPVHNERDTLPQVLSEWEDILNKNKVKHRFVVCEDGSTDGTKELLPTLTRKYPIILSQKKGRRGYGPAVIDGIKSSTTKYILCIDSDGQCNPKDFTKFWKKRSEEKVLIGWRVKRRDNQLRKLYSGLFKSLFIILYGNSIHDPSAPFVLFSKKNIMPKVKYLYQLQEGFWWGFTAMCLNEKIIIQEVPIDHRERMSGKTQVYKMNKIPSIALRNIITLIQMRFSD